MGEAAQQVNRRILDKVELLAREEKNRELVIKILSACSSILPEKVLQPQFKDLAGKQDLLVIAKEIKMADPELADLLQEVVNFDFTQQQLIKLIEETRSKEGRRVREFSGLDETLQALLVKLQQTVGDDPDVVVLNNEDRLDISLLLNVNLNQDNLDFITALNTLKLTSPSLQDINQSFVKIGKKRVNGLKTKRTWGKIGGPGTSGLCFYC